MHSVISSEPSIDDVDLFINGKLMYQEKKGKHGCLAVLDIERVEVGIDAIERAKRRFEISLDRLTNGDLRGVSVSSVCDDDVPLAG